METRLGTLFDDAHRSEMPYVTGGATYGAVHRTADAIRRWAGDRPESILLWTDRKELVCAGVLAALASRVSVVLPHSLSETALADIQDTVPVTAAVTDRSETLPRDMAVVPLTAEPHGLLPPPAAFRADAVFLRFFTGGSTGKPRIWSKTPRNVFRESFHLGDVFGVGPADRVLATVPPYHIYGFLFSVLMPFGAGASVAGELFTYPEEIRQGMVRHRPTVLVSVPPHYRTLGSDLPADTLRIAFSSAGKLAAEDAETFHRATGVRLAEIYGSTETGGIGHRCRADGETAYRFFSVVDWRIDGDRLLVKSDYIAPDIPRTPDGWFLTGDRVEKMGGNRFALKGRLDNVAKVGGKRVDLDRIAEIIREAPGVTDAVVLSAPSAGGREADILALAQGDATAEAIRRCLQARLEPYELPRRLEVVEKIPVVATGKIDRPAIERIFNGDDDRR